MMMQVVPIGTASSQANDMRNDGKLKSSSFGSLWVAPCGDNSFVFADPNFSSSRSELLCEENCTDRQAQCAAFRF